MESQCPLEGHRIWTPGLGPLSPPHRRPEWDHLELQPRTSTMPHSRRRAPTADCPRRTVVPLGLIRPLPSRQDRTRPSCKVASPPSSTAVPLSRYTRAQHATIGSAWHTSLTAPHVPRPTFASTANNNTCVGTTLQVDVGSAAKQWLTCILAADARYRRARVT